MSNCWENSSQWTTFIILNSVQLVWVHAYLVVPLLFKMLLKSPDLLPERVNVSVERRDRHRTVFLLCRDAAASPGEVKSFNNPCYLRYTHTHPQKKTPTKQWEICPSCLIRLTCVCAVSRAATEPCRGRGCSAGCGWGLGSAARERGSRRG